MGRRVYFDITSLARWTGPPVGIVRAQQRLAQYARRQRSDVVFTLFDSDYRVYREVESRWLDDILTRSAAVDMSMMRNPTAFHGHFQDRLSPAQRSLFYWLTKTRRKGLYGAEAWRLRTRSLTCRGLAESIVQRLMKPRERGLFYDHHGQRRACPAFGSVAGRVVDPQQGDVTIAAQFDWSHTDVRQIARMKQAVGFRHVVLCYDIIPIRFPEWYFPHDVDAFRDYYERALPLADCVVVNAECTADDVTNFCQTQGIEPPPLHVVPLGADPPTAPSGTAQLPDGLSTGKYAMFVSTIEPRKNHAMIVEIWRRLLRDGIPQRHQFSLVFVGRPGWKMDHFIPSVQQDRELNGTIRFLHGIDDSSLGQLYRDAAFCLFPPIYEGYGLPAVEAIAYGKPLLASTGGAIPEAVGSAAICLDPLEPDAWYARMREWIESPQSLAAARPDPTHSAARVTWDDSARRFFRVIDQVMTNTSTETCISQRAA